MTEIYKFPKGEEDFRLFNVTINGEKAPLHQARVSAFPYNTVWPGHQRPLDQTEEAAFVSFRTDGPCSFTVEPTPLFNELHGEDDLSDVVVRPLSRKIKPRISNGIVSFEIPGPGYYTVEFSGQHNCLHIFADDPETKKYEEDKEKATYRYEHGTFDVGQIPLKTGESIYIGEDAVVYGCVFAKEAKNIRIFGSGILDQSKITRPTCHCMDVFGNEIDEEVVGMVRLHKCENVIIEGVTFRDSSCWTITPVHCDNVTIDRIKMIGMWRYNADGVDFCNSRNGVIKNSFMRNFDDIIVLKGIKPGDTRNVENMYFSNCVLWCDWGRPLEIGAETCADEYRNIVFEDIDLIHNDCFLLDLQNGDRANVHDITFKNIRCEYSKHQLTPVYQSDMEKPYTPPPGLYVPVWFHAHLYCGLWSQDMLYGENHNIHIEDIEILADNEVPMPKYILAGANEEHRTYDIHVKNVKFNGKLLTKDELPGEVQEFADDIIMD